MSGSPMIIGTAGKEAVIGNSELIFLGICIALAVVGWAVYFFKNK
mgnify:CR=1|jgi:hypothetical protein